MQLTLSYAHKNIRLGQELGRGGEGSVFAIEERADQVAKIYLRQPDDQKVQKLLAMVETATPSILNIAAWPIDLLIDTKGVARGFVMPRIKARRDIHELYSPKSRSEAFPEADFRFLVHVGCNIARAFSMIHAHGNVLGDVNHGNLLVGPDGTVKLIDCDSFQVQRGTRTFTCDVGVPLFTAPELQEKHFRGLLRIVNHDLFGLAILLFHLLYMGRHPFAGRYTGPGEMPIDTAVSEYRFAYGPDRASNRMEQPPGTILLETFGPTVAQLFRHAFGRSGSANGRPDAKTWIEALEKLKASLRECSQASWHYYPRHLSLCPWCDLEAKTGVRLFGQRIIVTEPTGMIDFATLWKAITSVPDPGPDPILPSEEPWNPPPGVKLPSGTLKIIRKSLSIGIVCAGLVACNVQAKNGGFLLALLSFGLASVVWPHVSHQKLAEANRIYSTAKAGWESTLARWKREASQDIFVKTIETLKKAQDELKDLPNERRRLLAKLGAEREMRQRQRYLDRFRIARANIPGIGPTRTAMLGSYGIETAYDVNRSKIIRIPGFGNVLTSELTKWRRHHEGNFRFNPNEPIDQRDILAMDRDLEKRRQSLIPLLKQGPTTLRRLSREIIAARPRLTPILQESWNNLMIAEAQRNSL